MPVFTTATVMPHGLVIRRLRGLTARREESESFSGAGYLVRVARRSRRGTCLGAMAEAEQKRKAAAKTAARIVGPQEMYVLVAEVICALTGASRPVVMPADVLRGWATLLRNAAAFAYYDLSGAGLRTLVNDPAVLAMDTTPTALAALVNVLVIGGIYASIRAEGYIHRPTRVLLVAGATLLVAAITTAAVSTLDATAFYRTLFQLPVD